MRGADYYQLLSTTPGATHDELKNSYRRLSLAHHPDIGGSTEQMARLNEAYRILSNPLLRREYDQKLAGLELRSAYSSTPNSNYHYYTQTAHTRGTTPSQQAQQLKNFWRRFIIFAIFGVALLAYDVMSVIVLPSLVREAPHDTGIISNPTESNDMTDQVNAALSEMPKANQ